jgi:hypothetical protein
MRQPVIAANWITGRISSGKGARREARRREREEFPAVTKPVSNAEINRELTTLKRMFSLAVQADKLTGKPHIPMLQERSVRVGFFEPEQLDSVLGRADHEERRGPRVPAHRGSAGAAAGAGG